MELPIPKILLFLVLIITTNAKPTNVDDKLFSNICSKTKIPDKCTSYLKMVHKDGASSLEGVGVAFLGIAINRAKESTDLYNRFVKYDYVAKKHYMKTKFENCGKKYKWAMDKLSEAKVMLKIEKFAPARDNLEEVSRIPIHCENSTRSYARDVIGANEESSFIFDTALAVVRELERGGRKFTMALLS